jgi:hypothetical protein
MKSRMPSRVGASSILLLVTFLALAATELRINLRFVAKENVTANIPMVDKANPARPIEVLPLKDARSLSDLSLVGENREQSTPRPVRANSPVAEFATAVLQKCLADWGVRRDKGGLLLRGEITNLFVTEENTYSTQVSIRFRLEDQTGKLIWEGIASGDAHQWGRSFSEDNYNEQISAALKRTYSHLLGSSTFQQAWSGQTTERRSVAPAVLKAAIVKMIAEGIGADTITGYVRTVEIEPALTPAEMIDWKRSGIPEAVLNAAVSR